MPPAKLGRVFDRRININRTRIVNSSIVGDGRRERTKCRVSESRAMFSVCFVVPCLRRSTSEFAAKGEHENEGIA